MPTMTISQLIAGAQDEINAASLSEQRARTECQALLDAASAEGRKNLNAEESARSDELLATIGVASANRQRAETKLARAKELEAEDAAYDARAATVRPAGPVRAVNAASGVVMHDRSDSGPVWRREDGREATVARDARFSEHEIVQEHAERSRGREEAAIGQYGDIGQLVRSMTTTTGAAIVPTIWAANVIDRARNIARVMQAGAQIVPMESKVLQIGRLTVDPTAAFRAEGGTITASDPTFDYVQLSAKTMSALVVGSIEWFADASNAGELVSEALAKALALQLDLNALYGGVTTGGEGISLASPPNPQGILANLLANAASSVLGSGANGTTITAATPWNELLTTYFTPQQYNETPNAILMNAKMAQKYAMTYDTLGQPLRPPPVMANTPQYVTNQIPSFTQGTMTNIATDIFCGNFAELLIGTRLDLQLQTLTERYAELGQVGILATWRGDVQLARPRAFSVYRYIGGS
jgi:HK97 family phage major capsid protein